MIAINVTTNSSRVMAVFVEQVTCLLLNFYATFLSYLIYSRIRIFHIELKSGN